jgi:hypothetical protein
MNRTRTMWVSQVFQLVSQRPNSTSQAGEDSQVQSLANNIFRYILVGSLSRLILQELITELVEEYLILNRTDYHSVTKVLVHKESNGFHKYSMCYFGSLL